MKLRKMLFSLILVLGMLFLPIVEAASPSSFSLSENGIVNYNEEILNGWSSDKPAYFTYKYGAVSGTNYLVLCTGDRKATATQGTTFTKSNSWSEAIRAGIAGIIISGLGSGATTSGYSSSSDKLYYTQVALWKYIQETVGTNEHLDYTLASLEATGKLSKVNELYNAGISAKNKYNAINNFAITLDASSLNFTLNGDVYESQVIKVSGSEIKSKTASVSKGTIEEKNGGYVVKVNKSLLSEGSNTITFKVDATSNTVAVASNYSNGRSAEQTTTITLFDTSSSKTASKTITGKINIETNKLSISKQDAVTGKEVPNATLELTMPDGTKVTWRSENTPHVIDNPQPGEYTLKETIAPKGYIKSTETVTFTIDANGHLVGDPVVMKNVPKDHIYISKQDITTGKELPGAELVLKNSKGEKVDSWTSGSTPHKVKVVLEAGEYTLTETAAPEGYEKSEETITFTVKDNGEVDSQVVMYNKPKKVDNPQTGSTLMYSLIIAFVAFAVSFYFYVDYKYIKNM